MANNETEMTLSSLFRLIRKSLIKILIYALSSILILSAVLVSARCLTGMSYTESTITVADADATTSKILTDNKNAALTTALNNQFGSDADKYISSLSRRLTVTPVTTDASGKDVAVTTQFTVSLSEDKSLKLSKRVYASIVNAVQAELVKNYVSQQTANLLDPVIAFEFDAVESTDSGETVLRLSNRLIDAAKNVRSAMNAALYSAPDAIKTYTAATKDKDGKTTIKSLTQIYASINSVIEKIEAARDDIMDYRLVSAEYLQQVIDELNASLTAQKSKLTTAENNLRQYAEMRKTTVGGNGSVTLPESDAGYISLANDVKSYQITCSSLQETIDKFTAKKNSTVTITKPDGYTVQTANASLNDCVKSLETIVAQYEDVAKSYNENGALANYYGAPKKHVEYSVSTLMIVLINAAALVISVIVACAQTFDKMKKAGELNVAEE